MMYGLLTIRAIPVYSGITGKAVKMKIIKGKTISELRRDGL
jgi:hypothetical protein